MRKPKCYISGPMRGHPELNWPAFDRAAAEVALMGYEPVSPADIDRDMGVTPDN